MTANTESSASDSNERNDASVDPVIRSDVETDERFLRSTAEGDDPVATIGENITQAGSVDASRGLNSAEAIEAKKQFRRQTDSKIVSTASVGTDRVLILESQSTGEWMTRVPAERRAVLKGQRIWRIPDNWERRARIANENGADELLFRIPETRVDVAVVDLECGGGSRAGYRVDTIGMIVIDITEMPDKSSLQDLLVRIQDDETEEVSSDIEETLQLLLDCWSRFESAYVSYFHKWASIRVHTAFDADDDATFDDWSVEPWEQPQTFGHFINDVCGVGREISESLNEILLDAGVVSPSPTVTIRVRDEQFPMGYGVQALVEAGCSPSEAVDYLMDRFQDEFRASWESARSVDDSTVRDNVRATRHALYA